MHPTIDRQSLTGGIVCSFSQWYVTQGYSLQSKVTVTQWKMVLVAALPAPLGRHRARTMQGSVSG